MDRLDQLSSYFKERERKKVESIVRENNKSGIPEMSPLEIRLSCLENNGYESPELNDKLYLHFKGFRKIQNLENYTGCKAIWLDSNGIDSIEGLNTLVELRCLYLAKNLISKIDGLKNLQQLVVLDLSYNRLTMLENLSCCPSLQTINLARNALGSAASIEHLTECKALQTIDLTNNQLQGEEIFDVLMRIPSLISLSINGNEFAKTQFFRKRMITSIPKLGYLDRPVEEREKLAAVAFMTGGAEAEDKARDDWREMQRMKRQEEVDQFRKFQAEHQKKIQEDIAAGRRLISPITEEEKMKRAAGLS